MTDTISPERREELKELDGILEDEEGRLYFEIPVYYL